MTRRVHPQHARVRQEHRGGAQPHDHEDAREHPPRRDRLDPRRQRPQRWPNTQRSDDVGHPHQQPEQQVVAAVEPERRLGDEERPHRDHRSRQVRHEGEQERRPDPGRARRDRLVLAGGGGLGRCHFPWRGRIDRHGTTPESGASLSGVAGPHRTPYHHPEHKRRNPRRQAAPVAQLDRASASGAEGWWFEPTQVYFLDPHAPHDAGRCCLWC